MTENDKRILARACGLCWHEYGCNPTFTTPDDWEMVWSKFDINKKWQFLKWLKMSYQLSPMRMWLTWELKSPEEKCQDLSNFIKTRPDLFPWVVDLAAEIAKETIKSEPNPTQIASGKRMPWEE